MRPVCPTRLTESNQSPSHSLNLISRPSSAIRPRAIIWRRCPACAALKVLLAPPCPLRSTLTPDTAAKALASRFNRAPPVAARPKLESRPTSGQRRTVEFRRLANTGRSLPRERPSSASSRSSSFSRATCSASVSVPPFHSCRRSSFSGFRCWAPRCVTQARESRGFAFSTA